MPIDIEKMSQEIFRRATATGAKPTHWADLSGLSPSRISRAVNGRENLTYPELCELERLVSALEVICARSFAPVDFREQRAVRKLVDDHYAELRNPPPPPSNEDWDLMRRITNGDSPAEIASALGIDVGNLLERLTATHTRFEFVSQSIREITKGKNDLTALTRSEFDARKSLQQR